MKPAVLQISYLDGYGTFHKEPQGKFFTLSGHDYFLADMNERKRWKNFNGYSISTQIIDAFSKAKVRPMICYRLMDKNIVYVTRPSVFRKTGISVPYGSHNQFVLPIRYWETKTNFINKTNEPHGLPVMDLNEWLATGGKAAEPEFKDDAPYINQQKAWASLKEAFLKKHPELRRQKPSEYLP